MNIAIQAADLDHARIDGTRVYILNMLKHFGEIDRESEFFIYHKNKFNPELTPPQYDNYTIKKMHSAPLWTQTRFSLELLRSKPDALWMPMHNIPLVRPKGMKTTVTIHDFAFKLFPQTFPRMLLQKLNFLTDRAVKHADNIIAVSHSSKKDLLRFYPSLREEKITVVHHGFDRMLFEKPGDRHHESVFLQSCGLEKSNYILYTGAIQPRKNLKVLICAFEKIKKKHPSLKLVLAGTKAWSWKDTYKYINKSTKRSDIVMTGMVDFNDIATLYRNAKVFVYPSLYEGFGMPILEAFAAGTPVLCADNSSLPEVAGDGALYFHAEDTEQLSAQMQRVLSDEVLRGELVAKGKARMDKFSWEKCARETLAVIRG